jgi:hypothetical protein
LHTERKRKYGAAWQEARQEKKGPPKQQEMGLFMVCNPAKYSLKSFVMLIKVKVRRPVPPSCMSLKQIIGLEIFFPSEVGWLGCGCVGWLCTAGADVAAFGRFFVFSPPPPCLPVGARTLLGLRQKIAHYAADVDGQGGSQRTLLVLPID